MAVFEWYGEVEFLAELDQSQLEEYAAGARSAHYNSDDRILRLGTRLEASEYDDAIGEAQAWVAKLKVFELVALGRAAGPVRFVVESRTIRAKSWAVGTQEAAELLGVSTARVRQLEGADGFPSPVATPVGGKVYRRDEVETFARERAPRRPGRPKTVAKA